MKKIFIVLFFIILIFASCQEEKEEDYKKIIKTYDIKEIIPDLSTVDKIKIINGDNGRRIQIIDNEIIKKITNEIDNFEGIANEYKNYDRSGYTYYLSLYRGAEKSVTFTPYDKPSFNNKICILNSQKPMNNIIKIIKNIPENEWKEEF